MINIAKSKELWQRAMGLQAHSHSIINGKSFNNVIEEWRESRDLGPIWDRLQFLEAYFEHGQEVREWCEQRLDKAPEDRDSILRDFAIAHGIEPPGAERAAARTRQRYIRRLTTFQRALFARTDRFVSGNEAADDLDERDVFEAAFAAYEELEGKPPGSESTLRNWVSPVNDVLGTKLPIPKDSLWAKPRP